MGYFTFIESSESDCILKNYFYLLQDSEILFQVAEQLICYESRRDWISLVVKWRYTQCLHHYIFNKSRIYLLSNNVWDKKICQHSNVHQFLIG